VKSKKKKYVRLHDDLCTQFGSELSIDGQSVRMRDWSSAGKSAKSVHIGSYIGHFLRPFLYASGSNLSLCMPPSWCGCMYSAVGEGTAEVAKIDDTKPPTRLARVVAPSHPYDRGRDMW